MNGSPSPAEPSRPWLKLRFGLYCLLPPLVLTSILNSRRIDAFHGNPASLRVFFWAAFGFCLLAWGGWMLWRFHRRGRVPAGHPRAGLRRLDILCMNLLVLLLAGEGLLEAWGRMRPSPLFWSDTLSVRDRVNAMRWPPGKPYFNFRMNSLGYHDEEFFAAGPKDLVVVLVADSFGVGVVPWEYNFATVAERGLRSALGNRYERVAIHNLSIPSTGVPEYAYLLRTEALAYRPSLVVLCLFVGNDIIESEKAGYGESAPRYSLQNWLLWQIPRRFIALTADHRQAARQMAQIGAPERADTAAPDYILDPGKEPPTMSEKEFRQVEAFRIDVCNPDNPHYRSGFRGVFRGLDYCRAQLGDRLLVVLIPDEFQVNDALYEDLLNYNGKYRNWPRDYPQQVLQEYCRTKQIACVDLLPDLRQAETAARTYHLRDTHFNARGNQVAGEAIAQAILEKVQAAPHAPGVALH